MEALYDAKAPKKATNLSVNSDLLSRARSLEINLSATLERALQQELAIVEAKRWQQENQNSIASYNQFVEENGCFSDSMGTF